MHYVGPECKRPIGAMTKPFLCQRTGRTAQPQVPIRRRTSPRPFDPGPVVDLGARARPRKRRHAESLGAAAP
ncbi:hypothetical protein MINTM020_37780 [Mycobacterium paraintracellulare]|nr:hypothetical protein MINTM020_37780 [Mycobacterium paraintracellulare]